MVDNTPLIHRMLQCNLAVMVLVDRILRPIFGLYSHKYV
jgi:hypothetical protein